MKLRQGVAALEQHGSNLARHIVSRHRADNVSLGIYRAGESYIELPRGVSKDRRKPRYVRMLDDLRARVDLAIFNTIVTHPIELAVAAEQALSFEDNHARPNEPFRKPHDVERFNICHIGGWIRRAARFSAEKLSPK